MGTAAPIGEIDLPEAFELEAESGPAPEPGPAPEQLPASITPQADLFGVANPLTLEEVKRSVVLGGPRQLRVLVRRSELDPLVNMLALAVEARNAGEKDKAFDRFERVLPYVWAKLLSPPGFDGDEMAPGSSGAVAMRFEWKGAEE